MKFEFPEWLRLISGDMDGDDDQEVALLLAEPIGFDRDTYEGMSSSRFGMALNSIPARKRIRLDINSMGGRVDDGVAMYNMLLARQNVTTNVIGYAASAAALVHQAGGVRKMMPGTLLVIHNPQIQVGGEERDIEAALASMRTVKSNLIDVMNSRTKVPKKELSKMMDDVTSMDPKTACELGFCDEAVEGKPVYNDLNYSPKIFFDFCRSLRVVGNGGGTTAEQKKGKNMSKLTEALARLKIIPSANLSDEEAEAHVARSVAAKDETITNLTSQNTAHEAALKLRVTNRVIAAIEAKKIKAERKDALIAVGVAKESDLDFLDDIAVVNQAGNNRRGAPPVPVDKKGEGDESEVNTLRESLKTANPEDAAKIAHRLREIRNDGSHKDMLKRQVEIAGGGTMITHGRI